MRRPPQPSPAAGFSLVETMVAMVILSLTALSLAPLTLGASRAARNAEAMLYEQAILSTEVGRLNALPFDSLPTGTECLTTAASPLPHSRCTTVTSISSKESLVMVVVTPTGIAILKPDTVTFERTRAGTSNPLSTP